MSATSNIRQAIQNLNPKKIHSLGERPLNIALYAATPEDYRDIEAYLLDGLTEARRQESLTALHRGPDPSRALDFDLAIYDESVITPRRSLVFRRDQPEQLVSDVLKDHEDDLGIALARSFTPFRVPFAKRVIQRTSRENALFSLATALPDVIPSVFEVPWAVTEFASDTAVLTANQVRMAFLLAAASDRETGYREQKSEIASVIGGAFGWRALARQLIGKVPFGGGLIPKAAIAYAATKLVGVSLERYYRVGYTYTRDERNQIYTQAFERGTGIVSQILKRVRPDLWEKHAARAEQDGLGARRG
ncbi:MAG TPA: hypothetical protein VN737_19870 [Bryobacteraceae bacterium]|nr:hypothetical protein [Bryobacteraceae bacterium]